MHRFGVFFIVVFYLCVTHTAQAQEGKDISELALDDLLNMEVTTASRATQRIESAPGSITVITKQQISDMNARTLREVLNVFVPGMDVVPTYFRYGDRVNEGIYTRGLLSDFSQQVLILWNGTTKFNETTFSTPFPAIEFTLENVERIEVSRTPIPLYGSAAFTVINIITKEQDLRGAEGHLNLSSQPVEAASRSDALIQGKKFTGIFGFDVGKDWHVGGSAQFYQDAGQQHPDARGAGGFDAAAFDAATLRDGTKWAANATLSARTQDRSFVAQTWFKTANQDAFLSGRVPSQSGDLYSYQGSEWLTHIVYMPVEHLRWSVGSTVSKFTNFIDFAGTPFGGDETNFDLFLDINYTLRVNMLGDHSVLFGAKVEWEGQSDSAVYSLCVAASDPTCSATGAAWIKTSDQALVFAPNDDRRVYSFYAEDNWVLHKKLTLLGGFRGDFYDGFADEAEVAVNPRASVLFQPTDALSFKLLYASATRPPSIYERRGTALLPLIGSDSALAPAGIPSVGSEQVHTVELTTAFRLGGLKVQLTPFFQLFNDKIEYVPVTPSDPNSLSVATNNGQTRSVGGDLEVYYYFDPKNYLFATFSGFWSHDAKADRQTLFIPSYYASVGFNFNRDRFNWNVNGYGRGPRELPESHTVNREAASGYHLMLNTSASYLLLDGLKTYLLLQNLTDWGSAGGHPNYVPLDSDGFFVPIRSFTVHLGLSYSFDAPP